MAYGSPKFPIIFSAAERASEANFITYSDETRIMYIREGQIGFYNADCYLGTVHDINCGLTSDYIQRAQYIERLVYMLNADHRLIDNLPSMLPEQISELSKLHAADTKYLSVATSTCAIIFSKNTGEHLMYLDDIKCVVRGKVLVTNPCSNRLLDIDVAALTAYLNEHHDVADNLYKMEVDEIIELVPKSAPVMIAIYDNHFIISVDKDTIIRAAYKKGSDPFPAIRRHYNAISGTD